MMRNGMEALRFDFEGKIFGFGRDLYERCCLSCAHLVTCSALWTCGTIALEDGG